jgi:hypothetical protein
MPKSIAFTTLTLLIAVIDGAAQNVASREVRYSPTIVSFRGGAGPNAQLPDLFDESPGRAHNLSSAFSLEP